jgi:hypothetical protein
MGRVLKCLDGTAVDQQPWKSNKTKINNNNHPSVMDLYLKSSNQTTRFAWTTKKEICLLFVDDLNMGGKADALAMSLFRQMHDTNTFHADVRTDYLLTKEADGVKQEGQKKKKEIPPMLPSVETHQLEGGRTLMSLCTNQRRGTRDVTNIVGSRMRRHFMEFRMPNWTSHTMRQVLVALSSHFVEREYHHNLKDLLPTLIEATVSMVHWCMNNITSSSLTTFSYSDAAKIMQGVLTVSDSSLNNSLVSVEAGRLWLHEVN